MKPWTHQIDLSSIWRNDDLTFEEKRDQIVAEFRASPFIADGENGMELSILVDELAEMDTEEDFNYVWDTIYDMADFNKWLWINL